MAVRFDRREFLKRVASAAAITRYPGDSFHWTTSALARQWGPGASAPIGGEIPAGEYWRFGVDRSVVVTRPEDLFIVTLRFHNLRLSTWNPWAPRLIQVDKTKPSLLEIMFPPQHVAERVSRTPLTARECAAPGVATFTRPSRLVFEVLSAGHEGHVAFSREALLEWHRYAPRLVPQGAPAPSDSTASTPGLVRPSDGPDDPHTVLELPWKLWLSPNAKGRWAHASTGVEAEVATGTRVELWHTRLAVRASDGKGIVEDPGLIDRAVRAVWADELNAADGTPSPYVRPSNDDPEQKSLTPFERYELVHLTSNFGGLSQTDSGDKHIVRPLAVDYMHLSSLGATARMAGRWELASLTPPGAAVSQDFNLVGYDLKHGNGREERTVKQLVYYVVPHGLRVIVTVTADRWASHCGAEPAMLEWQVTDVTPYDRELAYNPSLFSHAGLETPFRSVKLLKTQLYHHSEGITIPGAGPSDVLWPVDAQGAPVPFTYEWVDVAGVPHRAEATGILAAARNDIVGNPGILKEIAKEYYKNTRRVQVGGATSTLRPRRVEFSESRVAFTRANGSTSPSESIDTSYYTNAIWFKLQLAANQVAGAPPFVAAVEAAEVQIPAVRELFKDSIASQMGAAVLPTAVLITALKNDLSTIDADSTWDPARDFWIDPNDRDNVVGAFAVLVAPEQQVALLRAAAQAAALREWDQYRIALWDGVDPSRLIDPRRLRLPTDKLGALASPNVVITGLSSATGVLSGQLLTQAGAFAATAKGAFDPADIFRSFNDALEAKLLGLVRLRDLLAAENIVGRLSDRIPRVQISRTPQEVRAEYRLSSPLKSRQDSGADFLTSWNNAGAFEIEVSITQPLSGGNPKTEVAGAIKSVALTVLPGGPQLVTVYFSSLEVQAHSGEKPRLIPHVDHVDFGGALTFIAALANVLPSSGGLPKESPVSISLQGLSLHYGFGLPKIGFGVFSLANVNLRTELTLPFTGAPPTFRFAFADLHNPFHLSVTIFGGGGHVGLSLQTDASGSFSPVVDASLEFGGYLDFSVGVASGGIGIAAGVYFNSGTHVWGGYLRAYGYIEVIGLITVRAEIYLGVVYYEGQGISAAGYMLVEIDILFFSADVKVPFQFGFPSRRLNELAFERLSQSTASAPRALSSDDVPTIADPTTSARSQRFDEMFPSEADWRTYCMAFQEA